MATLAVLAMESLKKRKGNSPPCLTKQRRNSSGAVVAIDNSNKNHGN
jgi:hypothetical protein